jgi:probable phosphoglycerate mutase
MAQYRQHSYQAPEGATQIILVRHGESRAASEENPFPLVDGHGDPELHANGEQQAEMVGNRLKGEDIDAIYVTSLQRTQQTAAPLCRHLGMTAIVEANLREVFLGEWEGGIMRIRAAAGDPIFTKMQEQQSWDAIPGAESWETLNNRIMAGLTRIHQAHTNQTVVAVVHGGVIGHIVAHASGAQPFAFNGADNGSISRIVIHGDEIKVRSFNDNAHVATTLHDGSGQLT